MSTFSDLMNLLLCFFVLLFAMSSTDADKWEQVVASFDSDFSIFDSGKTAIGDGAMVGVGTSQLNDVDEYYTDYGSKEDTEGEQVKKGGETEKKDNKSFAQKVTEANIEETKKLLDDVVAQVEKQSLVGYLDVGMDSNGKYVEILISGSVLFDSGSDVIRSDSELILRKTGKILSRYPESRIDIIGHTDNVPMNSSRFESNEMLSSARAIAAAEFLVENNGLDIGKLSWTGRGEYDPIADNSTAEGRARNRRIEIRIYNSMNSD